MDTTAAIANVVVAMLSGGVLVYVRDVIKTRRDAKFAASPAGREAAHVAAVDQTIAVVAHARDELAADNLRLRLIITEDRARHAEDRAEWVREKAAMRAEADVLEAKLRSVLSEVEAYKHRHRDT